MKNLTRKMLSCFLAAVTAFSITAPQIGMNAVSAVAATPSSKTHSTDSVARSHNLTADTVDGTILHAWCWSFKTIKANMKDIAAAGFSTIQTSPANACVNAYPTMKLMGNDQSGGTDGCWWWQYQPTDWTIGNYQLGSEQDFKDMCAEADKYGIKIIVDVIPNHTTPRLNDVSKNLINAAGGGKGVYGGLYHKNGFKNITQWGNRYECTTGQMGGLPDVNTENPGFQDYFVDYLNELVKDGCDGMRYDTAKHIGVPSDPKDEYTSSKGWTNNFWPLVTGKESNQHGTKFNSNGLFIYGEVLQGDNVPQDEYQKYLSMTASGYGYTIRDAIQKSQFKADNLDDLYVSNPNMAVTWVESHDTYCNNHESAHLTDKQIELGWAVLAAQKNGTPLFFSRPDGSNGAAGNYWGKNVLGAKGNNEFKSAIVKGANFFRNAMVGQSQKLSNPYGDKLLMIERGSKGVAFINGGGNQSINVATSLPAGTYKDSVSGNTFTVKNGRLTGTVNGQSAAFIYKKTDSGKDQDQDKDKDQHQDQDKDKDQHQDQKDYVFDGSYDLYYVNADNWNGDIKAYVYDADNTSSANSSWPGASMKKVGTLNGKDVYAYNLPSSLDGKNVKVIFTNGSSQFPTHQGDKDGLDYNGGSWKLTSNNTSDWTVVRKKQNDDKKTSSDIYFVNSANWNGTINVYAYDENNTSNTNGSWPGAAMTNAGNNTYKYTLPDNLKGKTVRVIFNNGSSQFPTHQGDKDGLVAESGKSYKLSSLDTSAWKVVEEQKNQEEEKDDDELIDGSYNVYFTNSAKWNGTINAYVYDPSDSSKNNGSWPGAAMKKIGTKDGNDVYAYNLPSSLEGRNVKVIFNNGSSQFPTHQGNADGLDLTAGKSFSLASLDISSWTEVEDKAAEKARKEAEEKARQEAEEKARKEAEEKARQEEEEKEKQEEEKESEEDHKGGSTKIETKLYSTNAAGVGSKKTIKKPTDFTDADIIAQGAANDDPRTFRGPHEGPVYDEYALYAAYDDKNLYLGWQYVNVADVSAPEQGYPNSDNGYPDNGDLPQMLAFYVPGQKVSTGKLANGGYVWGLNVDFETPITALACFSSKYMVGTPALFTAGADGSLNYDDNCTGFKKAGITYKSYRGVSIPKHLYGVNGNGYTGLTVDSVLSGTGEIVDFNELGHDTEKDSFYLMTIPLKSLGTTAKKVASRGIGVMHVSTFGASGIGSLPMDQSMLDTAEEAYSSDESTSAEKEDVDTVTVSLASVGKLLGSTTKKAAKKAA